jgi:uncharacterized protein (DUF4415 family)
MSKQPNTDMIDDENPEWSEAESTNAVPLASLPPSLRTKLRGRPTAAATKQRISIRLSPDVLEAFRATGAGWQTRIDAALRDWLDTHPPA